MSDVPVPNFNLTTDEFVTQLFITLPLGVLLILIFIVIRHNRPLTFEKRRKFKNSLLENEDKKTELSVPRDAVNLLCAHIYFHFFF